MYVNSTVRSSLDSRNNCCTCPISYFRGSLPLISTYYLVVTHDTIGLPFTGLIRTLRLDNNKLSGLPESLLTLTSLTSLSLRHNNFSTLPYRFGDLRFLRKLDLGENMLKNLPATMVIADFVFVIHLTPHFPWNDFLASRYYLHLLPTTTCLSFSCPGLDPRFRTVPTLVESTIIATLGFTFSTTKSR